MQKYFKANAQFKILAKTLHFSKYLSDKIKLYLELLLDSLFTNEKAFSQKVQRELQELMDDKNQVHYLQYAFLTKKVLVKIQGGGFFAKASPERLANFEFFFRGIFEKEQKRGKISIFLMYSFLRFATFVETPAGNSLITRFRAFPLVGQAGFWQKILQFMSDNVYKHLNKQRSEDSAAEDTDRSFMKTFTGFFKISKKNPQEKAKESTTPSLKKSFQEIASLLFRIGVPFESIVTILIKLSVKSGIKENLLQPIVVRNKGVLYRQLLRANQKIHSIQDLEQLKSKKSVRSFRFITQQPQEKNSLNESLHEIDLHNSMAQFEQRAGLRLSKVLLVVKLSLGFLVGKYDGAGQLQLTVPSFTKVSDAESEPAPFKLEGVPSITKVGGKPRPG